MRRQATTEVQLVLVSVRHVSGHEHVEHDVEEAMRRQATIDQPCVGKVVDKGFDEIFAVEDDMRSRHQPATSELSGGVDVFSRLRRAVRSCCF